MSPALAMAALSALALAGSGCPAVHVSHPVTPPSDDQPDPSAGYFTHSVQLTWSGSDLAALNSLTLVHPAELDISTDPSISSLTLVLPVDIQLDHHDDLANAYEAEIHQGSTLAGADPKIVFPARTCQEQNRVVTGICVRKLTVLIPTGKSLALDLAWQNDLRVQGVSLTRLTLHVPASGTARVLSTRASLDIQGGGPQASLVVDPLLSSGDVAGDCTAHLDSIGNLILNHVPGRVLLFVDHPEQSHVQLDGAQITQFPYQRP